MSDRTEPWPGQDAPEQVETFEIPAATAPVFPLEEVLHNSAHFFQRTIGGGMLLKFCPLVTTPQGSVPALPAVVVEFSPEGWDGFVRDVQAGERRPHIPTVRHFPEGLNGGPL